MNFARRKHPVNVLRRQQLDKFVLDYHPNTQRLQSMCEQYAGIVEQLEVLKPGSPDHQRLVQLSQLLGTALEESRSARTPADLATINDMNIEQLIARTSAVLLQLLALRDAENVPPPNSVDAVMVLDTAGLACKSSAVAPAP